MSADVPDRYRGVWMRSLLETPTLRDDTTRVHWLQTGRWHADLRIPAAAGRVAARQQGFAGTTEVIRRGEGEVCRWQRELDFQPPGLHPDEGWMRFETDDRVIETGIHGVYREVWERLPGSAGRFIALGRDADADGRFRQRLLVAGRYAMRVRARASGWPPEIERGLPLDTLIERHPARAAAWLDFEISFGPLEGALWTIEHSTLRALEGRRMPLAFLRHAGSSACVDCDGDSGEWQVVEWHDE